MEERKIREGFVLYHDDVLNHLQYLPDAEFKAIVVRVTEISAALSKREPEPGPPAVSGPAWGNYLTMLRKVRKSQMQYDKTALKNKMARNKKKPQDLLPLSNKLLLSLGYTIYDIAVLRECSTEEIIATTHCDLLRPEVTNRTEQNRDGKDIEHEHEPELDLENEPEYGFNGCEDLYAALETQGIKITPAIRKHLRLMRRDYFTEELMLKAFDLKFHEELRRLK